jgi:hypothetical protein
VEADANVAAATASLAGEKRKEEPTDAVWLRKKAGKMGRDKKRFFVLVKKEFRYHADCFNGHGVNRKGTINLEIMQEVGCSFSDCLWK